LRVGEKKKIALRFRKKIATKKEGLRGEGFVIFFEGRAGGGLKGKEIAQ